MAAGRFQKWKIHFQKWKKTLFGCLYAPRGYEVRPAHLEFWASRVAQFARFGVFSEIQGELHQKPVAFRIPLYELRHRLGVG